MSDIFLGAGPAGAHPQLLPLKRANRHGLIAGATGTGKTVTLQGLVEGLSAAGVPCLVADVKGDLAGLAMPGESSAKTHAALAARASEIEQAGWHYAAAPVQLWDLFGESGHPIRTTVSEMGPLLLGRLLGLTPAQEGVLAIAFHLADTEDLLLLDLDDLQAMLADCAARADTLTVTYGNVSKQSVGAIQRALLQLRMQGAEHFFGEPVLEMADLLATDELGRGVVNILAADRLMASPKLYSTFLLWLLSELFEQLPEVGDPDRPRLCFFFDEAHLLFDDAPKALVDKVEQVVRLIRSKGVGVWFITQNPLDIPDSVAAQLGHRIQHKLNAFTPREAQAARAAANTFRANPGLDVATAIGELKIGEALVSLIQADGAPSPVERTLIRAPSSRVGPLTLQERGVLIRSDSIRDKYDEPIDRESAEEILAARTDEAAAGEAARRAETEADRAEALEAKRRAGEARTAARDRARSPWDKMAESAARSASSSLGRQVANEIGKQVFGGRRRGASAGGLISGVLRGVLGGLMRGR